ncbi:MAG TPA: family 43 glycosylhydrolase, partial [Draconibacterium sp.]|nr:family 43 glycosylhydrolase [Draconibacterium sp.]
MKTKLLILLLLPAFAFAQAPETYKNPILSGFHPDPSICRVGDDYYLVNSSFEWYPGLPVFHSKDLVNWQLIGYGIHRPTQVELPVGLKDSRGVYAPTIRHHEGVFYIINTCVNCKGNFYITATNPAGPWSEPVWLGSH